MRSRRISIWQGKGCWSIRYGLIEQLFNLLYWLCWSKYRFWHFYLRFLKQVHNSVIVDLVDGHIQGSFPSVFLVFLKFGKYQFCAPGNQPDIFLPFWIVSLHGESLSTTSLAICEYTHINTVNGSLNQLRNLTKDLFLRSFLVKDSVKYKLKVCLGVLRLLLFQSLLDLDEIMWFQLVDHWSLIGFDRANSAVDSDAASDLLKLVVKGFLQNIKLLNWGNDQEIHQIEVHQMIL